MGAVGRPYVADGFPARQRKQTAEAACFTNDAKRFSGQGLTTSQPGEPGGLSPSLAYQLPPAVRSWIAPKDLSCGVCQCPALARGATAAAETVEFAWSVFMDGPLPRLESLIMPARASNKRAFAAMIARGGMACQHWGAAGARS